MRKLVVSLLLSGALALGVPAAAHADSGTYNTDDGPSCFWTGYGSSYTIDCSGYSRAAGRYVNYTCDLTIYGTSRSWNCRDRQSGATWRGSN